MGEAHAAKRWVEEHFPSSQGSTKAALILAYGSGLDAGLIEAQEAIEQMMMLPPRGIPSTGLDQVVSETNYPS